jgi:carboxypeptidase Taq
MRRDLPDLEDDLARGDTARAAGWLRGKVQRFGALHSAPKIIEDACGFAPTEAPLLQYLEDKFKDIYAL